MGGDWQQRILSWSWFSNRLDVCFDKAGGFRKNHGKLNLPGPHWFFFHSFLLSSPGPLHFRTQLLLLESQARRKNPGFSLGGSCRSKLKPSAVWDWPDWPKITGPSWVIPSSMMLEDAQWQPGCYELDCLSVPAKSSDAYGYLGPAKFVPSPIWKTNIQTGPNTQKKHCSPRTLRIAGSCSLMAMAIAGFVGSAMWTATPMIMVMMVMMVVSSLVARMRISEGLWPAPRKLNAFARDQFDPHKYSSNYSQKLPNWVVSRRRALS